MPVYGKLVKYGLGRNGDYPGPQLITYKSYLIGTPRPLPQSDLNPRSIYAEGRKTRGSVGGREGMMATWRYYVNVAEDRLRHTETQP